MLELDMDKLRHEIVVLASNLARGADISAIVGRSRVTADELGRAIEHYGATLTQPPSDAYNDIDPIAIDGSDQVFWAMDAPLWTAEEGRSDLYLVLTMRIVDREYQLGIDDVRTL